MAKIYLATSWKNEHYTRVLALLRENGHTVYDFREKGFLFSQLVSEGVDVEKLSAREQYELLNHDTAERAFQMDMEGLQSSDVLVMMYPCGNDAHLELGWAVASGLYTIIYINDGYRVGLMDKMANRFVFSDQQLLEELR